LLERALKGQAHIYDLTHVINGSVPTYDGESAYRYEKQADIDKQGYTLGTLHIPEHFGTHVDAPSHFARAKSSIDQLDPSHFIAPAVVIDVRDKVKSNPDYLLTQDVIQKWEQAGGRIPEGAAVLLLTGWGDRYANSTAYRNPDSRGTMHFPGYSAAAVDYLLKRDKVVALGIDTLSIDYGPSKDFEAHKHSLNAGLYHLENLANLEKLPARGAVVFVGALPIEGGSGSPARVLAIAP
jgi:kynurenine formamidase